MTFKTLGKKHRTVKYAVIPLTQTHLVFLNDISQVISS